MNAFIAITITSAISAALVGGVFFAFSAFVMRALSQLPSNQGVAAMQRINVVVINPLFLGVFLGTALLLGLSVLAARAAAQFNSSLWLTAAIAVYLIGSVGVTMTFNVPRNNRLAKLNPLSPEASAYWPSYVREWQLWNHVRCIASLVSAAAAAIGLAVFVTAAQNAA